MKKYVAKRGSKIGKPMMGCLYIHKSAVDSLGDEERLLYDEKVAIIDNFDFDIAKIDLKKNEVSFTKSPDWDDASEPLVGDRVVVDGDNTLKYRKGSGLIYHHKWMFVKDSYSGFDVAESKARSEYWMNHEHVVKLKLDKSEKFNLKIGRRAYWMDTVCSVIDVNNIKNN